MIITKTPFRMSFFGGGTDMEAYFREYGGAVISTTFDKYCYVTVRHLPRFFAYSTELAYSVIERVTDIERIKHPIIREAMKYLDMREIRLTYEADLPARSGLGTSSSFAVGMLHAFYCLKGKQVDKRRLADEAIYLERCLCHEMGGWQDQIAASFGGLNKINFGADGYTVHPIVMDAQRKKKLNDSLLMYFTGFTRISCEIHHENAGRKKDNKKELAEIRQLVEEAEKVLVDAKSDLDEFGRLLDHTWQLKRKTGAKVSTDHIDELYKKGIEAGAIGGKLLGAGGGGFLIFYVPPDKIEDVKKQMEEYLWIPFAFEGSGTSVVYDAPEPYEDLFEREARNKRKLDNEEIQNSK